MAATPPFMLCFSHMCLKPSTMAWGQAGAPCSQHESGSMSVHPSVHEATPSRSIRVIVSKVGMSPRCRVLYPFAFCLLMCESGVMPGLSVPSNFQPLEKGDLYNIFPSERTAFALPVIGLNSSASRVAFFVESFAISIFLVEFFVTVLIRLMDMNRNYVSKYSLRSVGGLVTLFGRLLKKCIFLNNVLLNTCV